MDSSQTMSLYITYVDKEGPFLKVWGQSEKPNSIFVEQFLLSTTVQFDQGLGKLPIESLQVGTLVCAKYKDNKYYRARITNLSFIRDFYVEVNFLDYGNKDIVPCENVRSVQNFPPSFISIPPLANGFIFAEAHCPGGGEWNEAIFDSIAKEIRYQDVQCKLLAQATQYYLVKLFINNTDIGALLINRGLMQPISLQAQQAVLLSMSMQKRQPAASVAAPLPEINTYKACQLEPGAQYPVYVSYVNDGPTLFSVQLRQTEDILVKLMKDINSIDLRTLEDVPLPGTICLARCQEDGNICRAVVTNEVDQQFKVFYVDFGNQEVVPLEALYAIPFKYVLPKVMAIRFGLAGVEKSTVTLEMSCAFKDFVDNRLLHMRVLPSPTRAAVPKCDLWDPEVKTSALEVLNRAARHAYPEPLSLNRGTSQPVKVSFVYSCNRFYVQLVSKEAELTKLMDDLQVSCLNSDLMDPSDIKAGLPCCALFEADQLWYRSEIVEIIDGIHVKVRYIDYGNEEVIDISQLRSVEGELLTVLRPQAIECCLNGYQNMEPDLERDGLLEGLILEQAFTMKVAEMAGRKALVELIDAANYNVASLLLDKMAAAKSQASPMLVQAGNKIEHRKAQQAGPRGDGGGYGGGGRPQARENGKGWNDRNEKPNEKCWRQENRERGTNQNFERDTNSNEEASESTWRQNNKGFNSNRDDGSNDLFNRDNDKSDKENDWFGKSNNRFNKDNDRFKRDNDRFGKDSDRFNKDNDRFGRDNDRFGKDNDRFNKDNDRFGRNDRFGKDSDRFNKNNDRFGRDNNRFGKDNDHQDNGDRFGRGKFNRDENRSDRFNRRDNNRNEWKGNDNAVNNSADTWGEEQPAAPAPVESGTDGWTDSGHQTSESQRTPRNREEAGGYRGGRFNNDDGRPPRRDDRDANAKPGFKKRSDFRKDGSEMSSSGSEKSFQKGPRTSSRNERGERNFHKRDNNSSFASHPAENSWNVSSVTAIIDAAPQGTAFTVYDTVGTESKVIVSWFHNPSHFYCQLADKQASFRTMMEEIQKFYKNFPNECSAEGALVVGLFPEDNVLYRAQVLELVGGDYKVFYVDFGNVSLVSKVWPIDKRFMTLPAQALCCGLAGVTPPGDCWPGADSYGKYFEKEPLVARFVNKDYDNKLYVNVIDGTADVARLLVQDGLAAAEIVEPPVEVGLLLGQQFRAVVKSVNNLCDIIVALECGVALGCQMHNVDDATETFEDALKACLEQTVIAYVDNVLEDNRLEVTFYDNDGSKLTILNPDEGAFDTVDPLCPSLILSSTLYGYVSHADGDSVYVQPSRYADAIPGHLERLFEFYEARQEADAIIPEEGMLYAVKSEDENWYRARVTNFDDEKATVCYVDYGNRESVPFASVRELDKQFVEPNMMCVQVHITDPPTPFLDKSVVASIYYGELGWEGTVQDLTPTQQPPAAESVIEAPSEPPAPVEPTDELENAMIETVSDEATTATLTDVPSLPEAPAETRGVPVLVSHTDSPNEFYVQLEEAGGEIEVLQARLQDEAPGLPALENVTAGVMCAAPYSVDSLWYRAQVLDADDDITTVRFIDYGNTDVINNQSTEIKTLPPELLSLAVYATRCSLMAKPMEEEWSAMALEAFERLTAENASAEFLDQDERTHYVELYADGRNVKEALIGRNLALPAELVGDNKSNCFISHLNSPSEFWIQLESCVGDLEWIAERLAGATSFPELEDLAPGTLCAALFPDDEMWYRARILSNTIAGIELLFVDYGNSCTSNSLRQLPEDLVVTPPLAQKCSLQRPPGLPYWTPQACEKFTEVSAEGQTIFTVKKISTGETAIVELLVNGEDIVPRLLPKTVDGAVKDLVNLEDFSVEKSDGKAENCKLEAMPGMVWDQSASQKFAEINKEGREFQVEFIDETTVRLYLDGHDIRPSLGGVKASTLNMSPSKDITVASSDDIIDHMAGGDQSTSIEDQHDSNFSSAKISSESTSEREATKVVTPDSVIEDAREVEIMMAGSKGGVEEATELHKKETSVGVESRVEKTEDDFVEPLTSAVKELNVSKSEEDGPKSVETKLELKPSETELSADESEKNSPSVETELKRNETETVSPKDVETESDVNKLEPSAIETELSVDESGKKSPNVEADLKVSEKETMSSKDVETELGVNNLEPSSIETELSVNESGKKNPNVEADLIVNEKETMPPKDVETELIVNEPDAKSPNVVASQLERNETETKSSRAVETELNKNESEVKCPSRPGSRQSINFDEKIVPGVVSRPHTPLEEYSDGKEEKCTVVKDPILEFNITLSDAIELNELGSESENRFDSFTEQKVLLEEKPDKYEEIVYSESDTNLNDFLSESFTTILTDAVDLTISEKTSLDRCQKYRRLSHDDRIIPGFISISNNLEDNTKDEHPELEEYDRCLNIYSLSVEDIHPEILSSQEKSLKDTIRHSHELDHELTESFSSILTNAVETALDRKESLSTSDCKRQLTETSDDDKMVLPECDTNLNTSLSESLKTTLARVTDLSLTQKEESYIPDIFSMPDILLESSTKEDNFKSKDDENNKNKLNIEDSIFSTQGADEKMDNDIAESFDSILTNTEELKKLLFHDHRYAQTLTEDERIIVSGTPDENIDTITEQKTDLKNLFNTILSSALENALIQRESDIRFSQRFSYEERIIPGVLSGMLTPFEDSNLCEELNNTLSDSFIERLEKAVETALIQESEIVSPTILESRGNLREDNRVTSPISPSSPKADDNKEGLSIANLDTHLDEFTPEPLLKFEAMCHEWLDQAFDICEEAEDIANIESEIIPEVLTNPPSPVNELSDVDLLEEFPSLTDPALVLCDENIIVPEDFCGIEILESLEQYEQRIESESDLSDSVELYLGIMISNEVETALQNEHEEQSVREAEVGHRQIHEEQIISRLFSRLDIIEEEVEAEEQSGMPPHLPQNRRIWNHEERIIPGYFFMSMDDDPNNNDC